MINPAEEGPAVVAKTCHLAVPTAILSLGEASHEVKVRAKVARQHSLWRWVAVRLISPFSSVAVDLNPCPQWIPHLPSCLHQHATAFCHNAQELPRGRRRWTVLHLHRVSACAIHCPKRAPALLASHDHRHHRREKLRVRHQETSRESVGAIEEELHEVKGSSLDLWAKTEVAAEVNVSVHTSSWLLSLSPR